MKNTIIDDIMEKKKVDVVNLAE
jgi:hypothetical protein